MLVSYAQSIAALAKEGAKIAKEKGLLKEFGQMCSGCAFNENQPHALCYFIAADQAAAALMSEGEFNCHTSDFRDANKPCSGFKLAKLVYEK